MRLKIKLFKIFVLKWGRMLVLEQIGLLGFIYFYSLTIKKLQ